MVVAGMRSAGKCYRNVRRYSTGVMPVARRNARVKLDCEENRHSGEMKDAETRDIGEVGDGDVFSEMLFDVCENTPQPSVHPAEAVSVSASRISSVSECACASRAASSSDDVSTSTLGGLN